MEHKDKAVLGCIAGILSYLLLLVISCVDVVRNNEAVNHVTALNANFLILLALVIFWYLPISISVHRNAKAANMKKTALISKVLIIFFTLFALSGAIEVAAELYDKPNNTEVDYYTSINQTIKDHDFYTARVSDNEINLYDKNNILTETIGFDSYDQSIPLIYIRKEAPCTYFITGGAVDDEVGILFMNERTDSNLDGIASLEHLGGNASLYSTR